MSEETKQLILEAVKSGVCTGKKLKSIPKTAKAVLFAPPGSASTMATTPSATPA